MRVRGRKTSQRNISNRPSWSYRRPPDRVHRSRILRATIVLPARPPAQKRSCIDGIDGYCVSHYEGRQSHYSFGSHPCDCCAGTRIPTRAPSRRIATIQSRIPGDISSTGISHRQGEIWIGGTTGNRRFPVSTTAAYRWSSTGGFPGWRPNRTPTRSCDTSNGSRDTIRRNCTPALVWRFGLAGAKSTCTKDYARGIGPVEVLSVLRPVPTRSFARVRHREDCTTVKGKPKTGGLCIETYVQV